jgi:predicted enzyme related to lactoylglutathione lyase/ketosteroid isomerase-like protein
MSDSHPADSHPHARLIRDFHERQNRFYAGGDQEPVRAMLTPEVIWHVPGHNVIAGEYRGRDEVLRYFVRRRELANATFRIDVRGVLADDRRTVILAGGEVERGGEILTWGTVGIFRVADGGIAGGGIAGGGIAECWVVPYDQDAFDEIWSSSMGGGTSPSPSPSPSPPPSPPSHVDARLKRIGGISYLHMPARNAREAAAFYRDVFGWNINNPDSDRPSFDDGTGQLSGAWMTRAISEEPGLLLYIYVERIDETIERIRARGGEIIKGPDREGELWIARFRDPAGNVLGLWHEGAR